MYIRRFLVYGAIALSGCGSHPTIDDVNPNALGEDQAIIVASTGAKYDCHMWHVVKLRGGTDSPLSQGRWMNAAFDVGGGGFEGSRSQLYAMLVKPGEYRFFVGTGAPPFYEFDPVPETEVIVVKPKEIKYVGEVYREGCSGGLFSIRDMRNRDLARLQQDTPALDLDSITIDILRFKQKD